MKYLLTKKYCKNGFWYNHDAQFEEKEIVTLWIKEFDSLEEAQAEFPSNASFFSTVLYEINKKPL